MRQWTIRELLLLIGILAFISSYAADALRTRSLPQHAFDLPYDRFADWAREIDPNSLQGSSVVSSGGVRNWPTTDNWHFEFKTNTARADDIVRNIRRGIEAHLTSNGWESSNHAFYDARHRCTLRRFDATYELQSNYFTEPIPVNQWNKDPNRVRLVVRWLGVGYTKSYGDMHLAAPVNAGE
jgi:hypothetical protein